MKKFVSFVVLAVTTLVFFSSCFQKYREPQADDGSGVSASSKWDWQGTAPFSGVFGGQSVNLNPQYKLETISNGAMNLYLTAIMNTNGNTTTNYSLGLKRDIKPGVYIDDGSKMNFLLGYVPQVAQGVQYQNSKVVVKIIRNDDNYIEGMFYGKLKKSNGEGDIMVENGYFYLDKTKFINMP